MKITRSFFPSQMRSLLAPLLGTSIFCLVSLIATPLLSVAQEEPPQALRVEVELVTVPVVVIGEEGKLYTDLKKENFTVLEDGQPQPIKSFESEPAPLTLVLLLEYSDLITPIRGEVIRPAGVFVTQIMEREDYVAVLAYDTRPRLLTDFTRDTQKLLSEVRNLVRSPPLMRESNLFQALDFVLRGGVLEDVEYKGLAEVKGRTGILLVSSGIDTFSNITYDDARDIVASAGVPIYSIAIGEMLYTRYSHLMSGRQRLTFLQGRSTLRAFSEMSGGRLYRPRFPQELDRILESIAAMLRFQYTLGYSPANPPQPGEKREIKVLVDADGDGRPDNDHLEVQHRQSYRRPKGEE